MISEQVRVVSIGRRHLKKYHNNIYLQINTDIPGLVGSEKSIQISGSDGFKHFKVISLIRDL